MLRNYQVSHLILFYCFSLSHFAHLNYFYFWKPQFGHAFVTNVILFRSNIHRPENGSNVSVYPCCRLHVTKQCFAPYHFTLSIDPPNRGPRFRNPDPNPWEILRPPQNYDIKMSEVVQTPTYFNPSDSCNPISKFITSPADYSMTKIWVLPHDLCFLTPVPHIMDRGKNNVDGSCEKWGKIMTEYPRQFTEAEFNQYHRSRCDM
jgi:hypothetical protein